MRNVAIALAIAGTVLAAAPALTGTARANSPRAGVTDISAARYWYHHHHHHYYWRRHHHHRHYYWHRHHHW